MSGLEELRRIVREYEDLRGECMFDVPEDCAERWRYLQADLERVAAELEGSDGPITERAPMCLGGE